VVITTDAGTIGAAYTWAVGQNVKDWQNYPSLVTPITAEALEDLETRVKDSELHVTLSADATITITGGVTGARLRMLVTQNTTGGWALTVVNAGQPAATVPVFSMPGMATEILGTFVTASDLRLLTRA
jgi:hypothetical protein